MVLYHRNKHDGYLDLKRHDDRMLFPRNAEALVYRGTVEAGVFQRSFLSQLPTYVPFFAGKGQLYVGMSVHVSRSLRG